MTAPGSSWGNYPKATQEILSLHNRFDPLPARTGPLLPYGNGRSYGDVCLNDGHSLICTRGLDRYIRFDPVAGILECEAGVQLADLIALTLPQGWFPAVTPGTKFVTVGGAIANDVHGKNHHRAGSFGHHVLDFELLRSDGGSLRCSPNQNAELFRATVGGLGLTGLIRSARLQLAKVPGPWLEGDSLRFGGLDEFFALSEESDRDYEHTVARVDCVAKGASLGRGILHRANWTASTRTAPVARNWRVPFTPPIPLINRWSLRCFNQLYFRWQGNASARQLWHYDSFFYPLDGIQEWNRIYGPRGFLQYQCVLPCTSAQESLRQMLSAIAQSGQGSFLAVLKRFGNRPAAGLLSFARPGVTLALDFPHRGETTLRLLESLDAITREARGAVYPAKDARMSATSFAAYYPQWRELERQRDPAISSSFWRRVTETA